MIIFVITMYNNAKSVDASKRCIESAKQYGYTNIMSFRAITPEDNPRKIFEAVNSHIFYAWICCTFNNHVPLLC